jgi:hypothetical protein
MASARAMAPVRLCARAERLAFQIDFAAVRPFQIVDAAQQRAFA